MPAEIVTGKLTAEFQLPKNGLNILPIRTDYQQVGKEQWRLSIETETSARTGNMTALGMYIGRMDRHDWVMVTDYVFRIKSIDGLQDVVKNGSYDFACKCLTGMSTVIGMKELLEAKHLIHPNGKVKVVAEITVRNGYRDINEVLDAF